MITAIDLLTKEANDQVRTRHFVARAALSAAVGLSLLGLRADPAAADTVSPLPIGSYRDMAVDAAHQQVFLSDPFGDSVLVTDWTGQVVKQIGGTDGAWGFALSADSGTLYVALRDSRRDRRHRHRHPRGDRPVRHGHRQPAPTPVRPPWRWPGTSSGSVTASTPGGVPSAPWTSAVPSRSSPATRASTPSGARPT
ncbi:hypothetical protein R2F25_18180 [Streptomyces sp. UP1A-1]|nr:hypothetical protein [Streptomyces sp. UP1A-1]